MADIRIHREHTLGLAKARQVAAQWAQQVEQTFDMVCSNSPGADGDTVEFSRSGVKGRLVVAADHFDLHAKLGLLLGAFAKTIEREILKNLDGLLGDAAATATVASGTAKPAAKLATKAAPKSGGAATPAGAKATGKTSAKSASRKG